MTSTACATRLPRMFCAIFPARRSRPASTRWSRSRNASRVSASPPIISPSSKRPLRMAGQELRAPVESRIDVVHIGASGLQNRESTMDELNGRMMACQILVTGLIERVANSSPDPLRFLTDFRDEIKAVVRGVNISGMENTDRVRQIAQLTVDELFSLMKTPSLDESSQG